MWSLLREEGEGSGSCDEPKAEDRWEPCVRRAVTIQPSRPASPVLCPFCLQQTCYVARVSCREFIEPSGEENTQREHTGIALPSCSSRQPRDWHFPQWEMTARPVSCNWPPVWGRETPTHLLRPRLRAHERSYPASTGQSDSVRVGVHACWGRGVCTGVRVHVYRHRCRKHNSSSDSSLWGAGGPLAMPNCVSWVLWGEMSACVLAPGRVCMSVCLSVFQQRPGKGRYIPLCASASR